MTRKFSSKETFAKFLDAKDLYFLTSTEPKAIERIETVAQALDKIAAEVPLFIHTSIKEDVSNLKRYVKNTATSLEITMNIAIVKNETLFAKFGHLELVNGGKGVLLKWTDSDGEKFERDIDGLIKNSVVILVNETKSRLNKSDLVKFGELKSTLEQAIKEPEGFTTVPAGILPQLKGLRVVPVVSTNGCADGAKEACAKAGIHVVEPNGDGYKVTIHDEPASEPPVA